MKAYIGPYLEWYGPHKIAQMLMFWYPEYDKSWSTPEPVQRFGDWLSYKKDGSHTWFRRLCEWVAAKRKRTIKVRVDPWDTWSMDTTMSIIALPLLKQLRQCESTGFIRDEDAPEEFSSKYAVSNDGHYDSSAQKRWVWALDEMIWAHGNVVNDLDHEAYYVNGKIDYEKLQAYDKRMANAFRLFGVYYQALWT